MRACHFPKIGCLLQMGPPPPAPGLEVGQQWVGGGEGKPEISPLIFSVVLMSRCVSPRQITAIGAVMQW